MPTLESFQRSIISIQNLQMAVRTMKALAAVSIRQYESAVTALAEYSRTIELGVQIALRNQPRVVEKPTARSSGAIGAIVFGSDYGMVGQFNEQVASHAATVMHDRAATGTGRWIIAVGERATARLEDAGLTVEQTFDVPSSLAGITVLVQELLLHIETWRERHAAGRLVLVYNQTRGGAMYRPTHLDLLPVDKHWLGELATRKWPSRRLPTFTMVWEQLFATLIRQYLFVALYRACAESLASENTSRLAAMQRAEQHIDERLDDLMRRFHQQRQSTITAELLDIVAGVEALGEAA